MPMSVDTRESSAPCVSATYEPNDMPPAQRGAPGYRSCMKSSAARKSSISPGPSLNDPALAPAPRKLNRSTAQPMRLSAFAAWYTTFVCIVPPCVGSGCASTTAARSPPSCPRATRPSCPIVPAATGGSSSASSRPAGPASSRGGMAVTSGEVADDRGERIGPGDRAEVSGPLDHRRARVRNEAQVLGRALDRYDVIEVAFAGDDQRRGGDARAVGRDVLGRDHPRPRRHLRERDRRSDRGPQRAKRKPPPRRRVGNRRADFRAQAERRLGQEDRPENP